MVILSARWEEADAEDVALTAAALSLMTDKVLVVGPTPEYRRPLPMLLAQSAEGSEQGYANSFDPRTSNRLIERSRIRWPGRKLNICPCWAFSATHSAKSW